MHSYQNPVILITQYTSTPWRKNHYHSVGIFFSPGIRWTRSKSLPISTRTITWYPLFPNRLICFTSAGIVPLFWKTNVNSQTESSYCLDVKRSNKRSFWKDHSDIICILLNCGRELLHTVRTWKSNLHMMLLTSWDHRHVEILNSKQKKYICIWVVSEGYTMTELNGKETVISPDSTGAKSVYIDDNRKWRV